MTQINQIRMFLSLCAVLLMIAGCDDKAASAPEDAAVVMAAPPLERTVWRAEMIGDQPVLPAAIVTLELNGLGRVGGDSGCNRYIGKYDFPAAGKISFPMQLASTRRACVDEDMAKQEQAYLALLGEVESHAVGADGKLVLSRPDGKAIRYVAVPPEEKLPPTQAQTPGE